MKRITVLGQHLLPSLIGLLVLLVGWEMATKLWAISPLILPPPSAVAAVLVKQTGYLLHHAGITLLESCLGFLAGLVFAVGLATLFVFSPFVERMVYPYAIAFKAIPLVAIAPIIVVWFGTGLGSKVLMAGIISFFPILVAAFEGFRSIEPEALELMTMLSASSIQVFSKLRFPSALGNILAGMKIASTFSVVGAVVAEFISSEAGIGYVIKTSSYYLDTDVTFAAVAMTALIGIGLFGVVNLTEKKLVFWKNSVALS
jgi:NitT/TauT family transport system permease protein